MNADIEFEEYPGKLYEVRLSPVSVADLFEIEALLGNWVAEIDRLLERFAAVALVSLPSGDEPTAANLRREDINLVLALVRRWIREVAEAPLPLPRPSSDGEPSQGRSRSRKS